MSGDESVAYVKGERAARPVNRLLSGEARMSNSVAIGLVTVFGLGSLTWYYANAMMRSGRVKDDAQAAAAAPAQGDAPLPGLGRVGPPPLLGPFEPGPRDRVNDIPAPAPMTLVEVPLAPGAGTTVGTPISESAHKLAEERQMSGGVFSPSGFAVAVTPAASADASALNGQTVTAATGAGAVAVGVGIPTGGAGSGTADLPSLLQQLTTPSVAAHILPAQRLLLPKGAFIDCTLETAIDSTLPGMTTCVMATDTFGADGKVVLLERGTKLTGETRGQVQQGAARIFVVWTEARTPPGVVVPLDSPGADELGRSGLPGAVNRHFWQRFGAALLVSIIDGTVQSAAQSSRNGNASVVINPSASQDVLTEVLRGTVNIPPTIVKHNGERIQVLVARDVDFRQVYELKSTADR